MHARILASTCVVALVVSATVHRGQCFGLEPTTAMSESDLLRQFKCRHSFPHCGLASSAFTNSAFAEIAIYSVLSPSIASHLNLSVNQKKQLAPLDTGDHISIAREESILAFLDEGQKLKIECIALYIDGCASLTRPRVQQYFKLSNESIEKIAALSNKYRREVLGPLNSAYFASNEGTEGIVRYACACNAVNVEFNIQVIDLLNEEETKNIVKYLKTSDIARGLAAEVISNRYRYSVGLGAED